MFLRDSARIASLAVTDLGFEWVLSLCMVLALGAVFAPLFILLGLREGVVDGMLDELRRDPESRLVMPRYPVSRPLPADWLAGRLDGAAAVVVPSRTGSLLLDVEGADDPVNSLPTLADDPLLVENGMELRTDRPAVVLSRGLAIDAGKGVGDAFEITLIRNTGREERVPLRLPVAAVLPGSEHGERKLWLPLSLFEAIDRWRDGQAAPALGLGGAPVGLAPEFDGAIAILPVAPKAADYRRMLARRMLFARPPELLGEPPWRAIRRDDRAPATDPAAEPAAEPANESGAMGPPHTSGVADPARATAGSDESEPGREGVDGEPSSPGAPGADGRDGHRGGVEVTAAAGAATGPGADASIDVFAAESGNTGAGDPDRSAGGEAVAAADDGAGERPAAASDNAATRQQVGSGPAGFTGPGGKPGAAAGPHYARWRPIAGAVTEDDLDLLVSRHEEQGIAVELVPYIAPFPVRLRSPHGDAGIELKAVILPEEPACAPLPEATETTAPCVAIAAAADLGGASTGILTIAAAEAPLEVPVRLVRSPRLMPGWLGLSRDLGGRLKAARVRDARYDPATGEFNAVGAGLRFFRAYAPDIDGLELLVSKVREQGAKTGEDALLEPVSRVERVRRIRQLADALLRLYLLIALITGVSGIFAVAANVYAGVQRKRVDLAYLQLLGLHRLALILFPTIKSLLLVVGGIALALIAYTVFDGVASDVFAGLLPADTELARLGRDKAGALIGVILAAATLASLVAALTVLRIEPGNYIRE